MVDPSRVRSTARSRVIRARWMLIRVTDHLESFKVQEPEWTAVQTLK